VGLPVLLQLQLGQHLLLLPLQQQVSGRPAHRCLLRRQHHQWPLPLLLLLLLLLQTALPCPAPAVLQTVRPLSRTLFLPHRFLLLLPPVHPPLPVLLLNLAPLLPPLLLLLALEHLLLPPLLPPPLLLLLLLSPLLPVLPQFLRRH
jgi:hypothetical protein